MDFGGRLIAASGGRYYFYISGPQLTSHLYVARE
jgi:hypothetical protein